ncbi:MAG: exodeoxyribonuclease V subunit alpha [Desulfurivibrionaceae bacterium]|nr:exodeoxyribonuclease V subunit alpha [Desulfurivibrionaceae bacterium]
MNQDRDQGTAFLERAFADFMETLAGEESSPTLMTAVRQLSRARSEGHICLDLASMPGDRAVAEVAALLLATAVVGGPGERVPLIIEGPYLYLHRYHQAETQVADFIRARCHMDFQGLTPAALRASLARFFPGAGAQQGDWQQVAAMAALTRKFTVISGGPGTGKTTTVAKILALYLELHQGQGRVIRLAAPTGKAAARLQDSIQQVKAQLPVSEETRAALPSETVTIHRLLGLSRGRPRYDRHHPLPADLVVIDEASMVDLPLMAQLMEALPAGCSLILLGDHYQLSSVQPGAVLGDICGRGEGFSATFAGLARDLGVILEEAPSRKNSLADGIITLCTSYRFGAKSGIRRLSAAVNSGQADEALALLNDSGFPDVRMFDYGSNCDQLVATELYPAFAGLIKAQSTEDQLAALNRFGVLCAHRRGPAGMERINALLVRMAAGKENSGKPLYPGLPIMVAGNSYELQLYNGDTGVIHDQDGRLYVSFADGSGLRQVLARRLPPYNPAYAMTVHKSQGSEFDRVVVVLPAQPSRVLGRELLYTALTRARQSVEIWGNADIFRQAVATPVARVSGLARRLWGDPPEG